MSVKDSKAELSTITYDRDKIEDKVGSIYEAIVIMGKRAEQINAEIRGELHNKLDEFAVHNSTPVSYTHLDVYKRQLITSAPKRR